MIAARAMLAVMLLLMLVAGSIVWPASASGPLCAMACCAGKAPHAAGSCMHGSCETGVTANKTGNGDAKASHHHQEQHEQDDERQHADADRDGPRLSVFAVQRVVVLVGQRSRHRARTDHRAPPDRLGRTAHRRRAPDAR